MTFAKPLLQRCISAHGLQTVPYWQLRMNGMCLPSTCMFHRSLHKHTTHKTVFHRQSSCAQSCWSSVKHNLSNHNRTVHTNSSLCTLQHLSSSQSQPLPRDYSKIFSDSSHQNVTLLGQQHCCLHKQTEGGMRRPIKSFMLSPRDIVDASPISLQPYLRLIRLDRPIGTWLLFLPSVWSLSMVAPPGHLPDPYILALFGLGSFLMRGAGCTINDMWDKDFDAKVERTKDRPLACGQLSHFRALTFLGLQLSAALAILMSFNWYTIILGASSMLFCVTYPLMKRITYWPQAFLGLTFNWGVLMGWSASAGYCDWGVVLPLYTSCFAWTIVYDTIYAHQDKEDDILVGVKSTALKFGDQTKYYLTGFSSVMVTGLTLTGYMADMTWPYYAGVGIVAGHLAHQIYTVDLNNTEDCGNKFRSNKKLGIFFWLTIMAANLLKQDHSQEDKDTAEQIDTQETVPETADIVTANS